MKFEFSKLSNAVLSAFMAYQRRDDLINKKHQLIKSVIDSHNTKSETILFLGFDPWILADWSDYEVFVGFITSDVARFLEEQEVTYTRVFEDEMYTTIPFDIVIAADEFLTYADNNEQRELVNLMSEITNDVFITTLRDYKNLPPHCRDFSHPTVIKSDGSGDGVSLPGFAVFQEFHNYEYKVKSHWTSHVYENGRNTITYGPFNRMPMFFKQLAKFGYDAGASDFKVHKDAMFKSLLKKNFEHFISVVFK